MSISTVLGYRWDGFAVDYSFRPVKQLQHGKPDRVSGRLRRELRGKKVILVWDGLPAHKSRAVQDYLLQQRDWLTV
jgi:hypothetical protein